MSVAEPAPSGLETAAAARLYERHSSRVFGYCLRMLGSREDAEDAAQTTFMQAFGALQRGVVPVFETAWLLKIAKNVCLARYRSGGRRSAIELVRDPQDLEELAAAPEGSDGTLVGLQDALARLPEMQRRAFLLREWQGRSYAEIAEELDVTVPAVEALIFRARRALASDLGGETRRRYSFDLASLAGALKSLLGGGAAVKLAVGAAAVLGTGAVVGGAAVRSDAPSQTPPRELRVRTATPVGATPAKSARATAGRPEGQAGRPRTGAPATVSAGRGRRPRPDAAVAAPGAPAPTPTAPALPDQAPQPGPPQAPGVPEAPRLPDPPQVSLPQVPPAPPVPPVEVPQAPTDELPIPVPDIPEPPAVPGVPDLPVIP